MVLPFTVGEGISEKRASVLNEVFLTEISNVAPTAVKVVGASDVASLLDHAEKQQLLDCDDTSCLVEIGNALGASHIIAGTIGKFDSSYVINIKLIRVVSATVLYRKVSKFADDDNTLLEALAKVSREMALDQKWLGAEQAAQGESSPLLLSGLGIAAAGVAVAVLGGAGVYIFNDRVGQATTIAEEKDQAGVLGMVMAGGAVVGGALLVTGATLAIIGVLADGGQE